MTRATLPESGYSIPVLLTDSPDGLSVRAIDEHTGRSREFRFDSFDCSPDISRRLAEGFARATGPGGSRKTLQSAAALHGALKAFASHLATHAFPPTEMAALRPFHLKGIRERGDRHSGTIIHALRVTLRHDPHVPESFLDLLVAPLKHAPSRSHISGYSESEFRAIRRSMRSIVRSALVRVRLAEGRLAELPLDPKDLTPTQRALRHVALTGDVIRDSNSRSSSSVVGATKLALELFPTMLEISAAAVLMQSLTGHNVGTLINLTTEHHRADSQSENQPMILLRSRKPRRGRYRAELDLVFDSSNVWQDELDDRDDFNSPAGVYQIIEELTRRTRKLSNSFLLFVGYSQYRRRASTNGVLQGCRSLDDFAQHARYLEWTHLGKQMVGVNSQRNRRAFLEQRQRPVDHTPRTLADTYLSKDPTAVQANQRLVADVLDSEVGRVRASTTVRALTQDQLMQARTDLDGLAAELAIPAATLRALLDGELDTVGAACIDNHSSPHNRSGDACTASFLLCFGCPNARAEPRHAGVHRSLLAQLDDRRLEMSPHEWSSRYETLWEQVSEVLPKIEPAPRVPVTTEIAQLISDLLDGRLDLR